MKLALILLIASLHWVPLAQAAELLARKVWQGAARESPEATLRCRVASDEPRFTESLQAAQWQNADRPTLKWADEIAVIVAPQLYRQDYRMALTSVDQTPDQVIVTWALAPGRPEVVEEGGGTSGVTTHASTSIGPEIIVLVLPRETLGTRKVLCRGPQAKEL